MVAHLHMQNGMRHDQAQNCNLQAELESTSENSVLGESESCSKARIDLLSDEIERDHPSQHSPSILH